MDRTLTSYLDEYWQRALPGLRPVGAGVSLGPHEGILLGYPGIYVVLRQGEALISAPPELIEALLRAELTPRAAAEPAWWRTLLPSCEVLGPSIHAFLSDTQALPPSPTATHASVTAVADALRHQVSAEEWVEGGFDSDDIAHAWILHDDQHVVAAASLTTFDAKPADVGVITSAEHRGRGYGRLVGAVASRWAVENHGIARWRARATNASSRAIAKRLGFDEDCLQLAVRPTESER